jgi:hypothetical protein
MWHTDALAFFATQKRVMEDQDELGALQAQRSFKL